MSDNVIDFDDIEDEVYCEDCEAPMIPEYENNGFSQPDPDNFELVGFKCKFCKKVIYVENI